MNSHPLFLYINLSIPAVRLLSAARCWCRLSCRGAYRNSHSLRPLGRLRLPRCTAFAASLPFACPQQHAAGAGSPAEALTEVLIRCARSGGFASLAVRHSPHPCSPPSLSSTLLEPALLQGRCSLLTHHTVPCRCRSTSLSLREAPRAFRAPQSFRLQDK